MKNSRQKDRMYRQAVPDDFCPIHHIRLTYQPEEKWWRCPRPHCTHKITVAEIAARLSAAMKKATESAAILPGKAADEETH
jgi:hypothetical protein